MSSGAPAASRNRPSLRSRRPRVLLLWPGEMGGGGGSFGAPQLVILGSYLQARTRAEVAIRDLQMERAFGPVSLPRLLAGPDGRGYDVIGISVYSSFDFLKCQAIAEAAKARWPAAWIVAGGYHPSARPLDFIYPGSPFDVCVIGEGERPMVKLIEAFEGGEKMHGVILGPEPIEDLAELPLSDYSLLERYRSVARGRASQTLIYLSRGCPFDCSFCMERAKREVSWRPLPVEQAIEELRILHRFLDLRDWTLFVSDALFGMRQSWRRALLEALAQAQLPVEKIWMLIRVDLVEDEDLRLFDAAGASLGFGLESGDPRMLSILRKAGRLESYLERVERVGAWTRERGVPFGANVIVGHPGETEESIERSAAFARRLFLDPKGTTGFLSVDPFRLYPGSPVQAEAERYTERFGTVFHRPEWWQDGDPEFLSEWIDPSEGLPWEARERLMVQHFGPILAAIESNFVYSGAARPYFLRSIRTQVRNMGASYRLHYRGRYYAWKRYLGAGAEAWAERRVDPALRRICGELRREAFAPIAETLGLGPDDPIRRAIERVPRERFVPLDALGSSARDQPIALDAQGHSSVSAMHAYARSFALAAIGSADRVLDLGGGLGYGAALLAALVGPEGSVLSVELEPRLAAEAARNLEGTGARAVCGDALDPRSWQVQPEELDAIVVGFCLEATPPWLPLLREGARIVAPLRCDRGQRLARWIAPSPEPELFEDVLYVPQRSEALEGAPEPPRGRSDPAEGLE
ncbi:MAG: radical SAM protein [Myxococcales bacterium]|nr:radical SAM protein [Myxococcales bacterium]